jgi:hypothetical protein
VLETGDLRAPLCQLRSQSVNLPYVTSLAYHGICQHNLLFDPSIFITITASLLPLQVSRSRCTTTASSPFPSTSSQHLFRSRQGRIDAQGGLCTSFGRWAALRAAQPEQVRRNATRARWCGISLSLEDGAGSAGQGPAIDAGGMPAFRKEMHQSS